MRHRSHFVPLCGVLALLLAPAVPGSRGAAAPAPEDGARSKAPPDTEVRCADGSVLKLKLIEEHLTLTTPYGKLVIPVAKITEIDCATRLPDEVARAIARAIIDLHDDDAKVRIAASAELDRFGLRAYPALLRAEKDSNAEVRRRVAVLLEKLRESVPEESLKVRESDVVHTEDSKIAGTLDVASVRVNTSQFGEVRLKLHDVRGFRSLAHHREPPEPVGPVLPDPGALHTYGPHIGKVFNFQVVGAVSGNVWGTDTYTLDSTLAMAAVHAGVAQIGKPTVVRVRILAPLNNFVGSTRNGVASMGFGQYPGAYEFVGKK